MSKLVFTTRQGSLILGTTYSIWAIACFVNGFGNYMFWGLGLGMLILVYECFKYFRISKWNFKEDLKLVHKDIYSILWVYITVLFLLSFIFHY